VVCTKKNGTTPAPIYASAFTVGSSSAYKKDMVYMSNSDRRQCVDTLTGLKPAHYRLRSDVESHPNDGPPVRTGFIAEDLPPSVVNAEHNGVDLYALTTSVAAAVQALRAQVDERDQTIEQMRQGITALRHRFDSCAN